MKTALDCVVCFVRQSLDAARMVSTDPMVHERMVREVLEWTSHMDLSAPPPIVGQRIHRRLREISGVKDPYRTAKDQGNRMALRLLPGLKASIEKAPEALMMAVRLALAGNVIDMGVNSTVTASDLDQAVCQALKEPERSAGEVQASGRRGASYPLFGRQCG